MKQTNLTDVNSNNIVLTEGDWYYDTNNNSIPEETEVEWISEDTNVASVNPSNGYVYGVAPGETTVYAKSVDSGEIYSQQNVQVRRTIEVSKVEVTPAEKTLSKGGNCPVFAIITPHNATNQNVSWFSQNSTIATVSEDGVVTAVKPGKVAIWAIAQDGTGEKDYCCITVEQSSSSEEEGSKNTVKQSKIQDPIDVYSGAHTIENTVMTLYGGQGLKFTINYDSSKLSCGDLGTGWYHNYEKRIEWDGNNYYVYNSPSVYSVYAVGSDFMTYGCLSPDKEDYELHIDHEYEYPYILNCNYDRKEYYDAEGRLVKIVNREGFETLITYGDMVDTITDQVSGKKIYLEKDQSCKIVRVYDDASREATFTYSGGCITEITDSNNNKLTYTYNSLGQVLTGTDAKGTCYFTNTYDECNRIVSQKDGITGSITSTLCYDDDEDIRISTDRNGKTSERHFNSKGLLSKYIDENCNETTYTYDGRYNLISETDAYNNSVLKTYGTFNKPTKITDKNGNVTDITYDNYGNVTKILYPVTNGVRAEETFVYNTRNQVIRHTDMRGTVTVYTYDTAGMPATKKVGDRNAIQYSYENGLLKSETDAMGNTVRYTHNAIGQVISMTDAANNVTQYQYDACGNLLKTTYPNGKTVINTYDSNHQKTSVTDANGNKTEYSYNGNMKNTLVTLPDDNTIKYEYDGEDRNTKIIDQANNVTTITYDDAGRVKSKRFADGALFEYQYDAVGNVIEEKNPKGAVTTKTYDKKGNVITVIDDEDNVTSYEYNYMSKVTKMINAVAGTTVYTYSKAGDLLSETNAQGKTKTYTYDAYGNKLTETDARNNTTTYTYDANNNMLTSRDALGNTTTYTYNCLNQLTSVKDAKNNTIRYGYDAMGRRTTITDAKGNVFTTHYDGNGNVIKTTDAKGNTISETTYNCLNLPARIIDATGKTTDYTYNALGKVWTTVDSMNHSQVYTYNSRGQNTSVRDAANNTSSATYDLLGNITRLAGPLGGAVNYTYDNMGRLESESTASGGTKRYTYNQLNIRKKVTNARNQVREMFYDNMGRISGYTSPEGAVSYTYDDNGNVLTVTDNHGTITRTYDALNRVSSCTDTYGKVIRYEYDAVGNLSRLIYPDNSAVTYTYDANNNLTSVTDWQGRVTTYTYDVNNRVVGVVKPDGSVTTTVYDNKQRVTSTVERTVSGAVITGFEYTYDSLSRIVDEKCLAENKKMCYTYDSLNRVTKRQVFNISDNSLISEESYSYDAAGNITNAPESSFAYDTNNRLIAFNGNTVSYDLDGNMLNNGEQSFIYDSANRLISSSCHTYTYNAEDVRIRNLCPDSNTTYTYNTNCELSQLLEKTTDGTITKYVYGHGLIGEEECCDTFKTYHFDFRGSTVAITDEDGDITDTFKYDTYGNVTEHIGEGVVIFGYNGRDGVITDDNGLIYMRARYYSPEMRRFINADILHGEISDSTSLNRYSFVNGNPVSFVDPFGLYVERGIQILQMVHNDPVSNILFLCDFIEEISSSEEFDYVIEEITGVSKETHYERNNYYLDYPDVYSEDDPFFEGWRTETASCHQFSSLTRRNVKYISPDGKHEVIYDKNGKEVLDIRDIGTYNYASPITDGWDHFVYDVVPWLAWGNAPEDNTNLLQRAYCFGVHGSNDKVNEYVQSVGYKIVKGLYELGNSVVQWVDDLW